MKLSGFSRERDYRRCCVAPGGAAYFLASALRVYFTARIGAFAIIPPFPSGGGRVTSPSPRRARVSSGILTASSIGFALRLILRTRLTLNRLTLFRKPWSFGEGASHPLYRYLYLHLRFQELQQGSAPHLRRTWNAPLPMLCASRGFGNWFNTRLLSTPSSSTSELLRTL